MSARSAWFVVRTWLVFRAALIAVMFFAHDELPRTIRQQGKGFLHAFTAWDGRWYHDIVKNGYSYVAGRESNVAFFPAYPFTVRALTAIWPDDFLAGVILSNALFVPALLLLFAWANRLAGRATAERAVRYALLFPSTHFFSSFYTESMFLLAVAGAFYAYESRRLWLYLPFGFFAGCTRSAGVLVIGVCVVGELVRFWNERAQRPRIALTTPVWFAPLLGLGAYMWHLQQKVGDPLAFLKAQAAWGRHTTAPWTSIANEFRHPLEPYRQFEACAVILMYALIPLVLKRLPLRYGLFLVAQLLLSTTTAMTASAVRYMAGSAAVYLFLALLGPRTERWLLPVCAVFAAFAATCYAGGYWSG